MTISDENRSIIRKFENIMRRGLYASGEQVTQIYNSVLEKNVRPTNCGSCIRSRITELVNALNKVEADEAKQAEIKALEALKEAEANNTQEPLKEANKEAAKEEKENGSSGTPKTRGRKKK